MADHLIRSLLAGIPVRVVSATSTALCAEAANRHGAVAGAAVALARASTAGLLLATLTKGGERVTLQILGDGPLGSVTVDANDDGEVRSYLKHPSAFVAIGTGRASLGDGVGRTGLVNVVRDLGMKERYSGQVHLVNGEIDEDVERYLCESEQVVSALGCDAILEDGEVRAAGGVLVQCMPGQGPIADAARQVVEQARERLRSGALFETLSDPAAAGDAGELARRVLGLGPEALHQLERQAARFHCACSPRRVAEALALLADAELEAMIQEDGGAEVTCAFCASHFRVPAEELRGLLAARRRMPRGVS